MNITITMRRWRPIVLASGLVAVLAAPAAGQNVIVREGPPGTKLEVVLNAKPVGTATFDAQGEATVPVNLAANAGKPEADVTVEVDVCTDARRVIVVARGEPGFLPQPGCDRQPISGLYFIRRQSTLIVRLGSTGPSLMLLQREPGSRAWNPAPSGLMVFGGGGMAKFSDAAAVACGTQASCSGGGYGGAYTGGVEFWPLRFVGVEATFLRPLQVTTSGSGTNHRFTSDLDAHAFTVSGKAGLPLGPVRIYGRFGTAYHGATITTSQTYDDRTVTVDGVEQTIPGGTQTSAVETKGWGLTYGGGLELWVSPWLAIYGDAGRTAFKGDFQDAEGLIDDTLTSFLFGARVRIGGW